MVDNISLAADAGGTDQGNLRETINYLQKARDQKGIQLDNTLSAAILQAIAKIQNKIDHPDQAMKAHESRTGGIDLTPARMDLQVKKEIASLPRNDTNYTPNEGIGNIDMGIKFHLDPAMLQQLQDAPGFVPVIVKIQPLNDLKSFLDGLLLNK